MRPDEVEDERAIGDRLAKVAEVVCHTLQTPAVVGYGEITLDEAAELGVEVECPSLAVAEELRLDGDPGGVSSGATRGDGVGEVVRDRAEDLGLDNAIHACPI